MIIAVLIPLLGIVALAHAEHAVFGKLLEGDLLLLEKIFDGGPATNETVYYNGVTREL